MTAHTAMSREELIELAALDALGLLDDIEAALYTRAFLNAPETLQQELRELQAQFAADPAFIVAETPVESLRDRVLAAVNRAIETEDEKLAPIATIGRRRASDVDSEPRYKLLFAARFWRAACFALCGGLVVLSYFLAEQTRQGNRLGELAVSDNTSVQLEEMIGPTVKDFMFDAKGLTIHFDPSNPASKFDAVLYVREDGKAFLVTDGLTLSNGKDYSLKMVDRRGTAHHVADFDNIGRLAGRQIVAANYRMASSWEIHGPDGVIMTSIA